MNEQVLVAVVGGDETDPLVVAEPLHCASRHVGTPPRYVRAARGGCFLKLRPASACTTFAGLRRRPFRTTVARQNPRVLRECCGRNRPPRAESGMVARLAGCPRPRSLATTVPQSHH